MPERIIPPVHERKKYHHIRIRDPDYFEDLSFRVIQFNEGIKATIGCPKGKFNGKKCIVGTKVQKILFPKDKYSKEEARTWVKKHPKIKARKKK